MSAITGTQLPGAYQRRLPPPQYLPNELIFVYDYGWRCGNTAEGVRNASLIAGRNLPSRVVAVNPFDTKSAGVFTSLAAAQGGSTDLFIANVAPGLNVASGTTNNQRERFLGTVLPDGAVVTGTDSSDLFRYVAFHGTPVYDIGYNTQLGSQIRGRDAFPASALQFYELAQQNKHTVAYGKPVEISALDPTEQGARLLSLDHSGPVAPGQSLYYVISDHPPKSQVWRPASGPSLPIATPPADAVGAGFNAFQLALGGQLDQTSAARVPAVIVVDIAQSRQAGTPVWVQELPHGVTVIGPGVADAWLTASADSPIVNTGLRVDTDGSIGEIAEIITEQGLRPTARNVDRGPIALPSEPMALRVDPFGNLKFFTPDPSVLRTGAQATFDINGTVVNAEVLDRLFDREVGTVAVTTWGSSGGWWVNTAEGRRPLQVPEVIRRCEPGDVGSIAATVGLTPAPGGYVRPDITLNAIEHTPVPVSVGGGSLQR